MDYKVLPNGNLQIILDPEDREDVAELYGRSTDTDHGFLADLLDYAGWLGNGVFEPIAPERVGALTDAPMLSDDVTFEFDTSPDVRGTVWWYPWYETLSFGEILLRDGRVTFMKG